MSTAGPLSASPPAKRASWCSSARPFYAESGGQVGDSGSGKSSEAFFTVTDTKKAPGGAILHDAQVLEGGLQVGDSVWLEVDPARRQQIAIHHTATHMLQAALREVLGPHVKQAGSRVGPDKLRFDFTHFAALSAEELAKVERAVNEKIRENLPVAQQTQSYEEAVAGGRHRHLRGKIRRHGARGLHGRFFP